MSTKEKAYSIIDNLDEEELERFVAYFEIIYPRRSTLTEKQAALQQLNSLIRHIPDLDDDDELRKYREEKYGR